MSEQGQRQTVVKALKSIDAISVENSCYPGTPDINHIHGWIELKWLRSWPKRSETIVQVGHFTQQQRVWLLRRWVRGGSAVLLIQVKREWLLLDGDVAFEFVGRLTREELIEKSRKYWPNGLNKEELLECVRVISPTVSD